MIRIVTQVGGGYDVLSGNMWIYISVHCVLCFKFGNVYDVINCEKLSDFSDVKLLALNLWFYPIATVID